MDAKSVAGLPPAKVLRRPYPRHTSVRVKYFFLNYSCFINKDCHIYTFAANVSPEHPADHHCQISKLKVITLKVKVSCPRKQHSVPGQGSNSDRWSAFYCGRETGQRPPRIPKGNETYFPIKSDQSRGMALTILRLIPFPDSLHKWRIKGKEPFCQKWNGGISVGIFPSK